jgi:hypothetical protein
MKELHEDELSKIKVCNKEIDKKERIINDFIDNIQYSLIKRKRRQKKSVFDQRNGANN